MILEPRCFRPRLECLSGFRILTVRADLYYGLGIILMNGWMVQNPRFGGYNLIFAHLPAQRLSIVLATTMGPKCTPDLAYSTLIFKELVKLLAPDAPIPEEVK